MANTARLGLQPLQMIYNAAKAPGSGRNGEYSPLGIATEN